MFDVLPMTKTTRISPEELRFSMRQNPTECISNV